MGSIVARPMFRTTSAPARSETPPPNIFPQAVIDGINMPVMAIGLDYRILMANQAARAAQGRAGLHCYEVSHGRTTPCDGSQHPCPLQQVMAGTADVKVVHEHRGPDGLKHLVELSASPLHDAAGELIGIVEIAHDITAEEQAKAALLRTNRRLLEAQRIAHVGSWERDFASDRIHCSEQMRAIAGHHVCSGQCGFPTFVAAIHDEDRASFLASYERSVAEHRPFEMTHRLRQADGTITYVHSHCETFYDSAGNPEVTYGTVQDVTMSTLAELSLKESEERFRTIADYTYDWEYWVGPQDELLYCSPSCKDITGYASHEFVANPDLLYSIVHPDDARLMQAHHSGMLEKQTDSLTFRIVRADGAVRWIAHGCRPVYSRKGDYMGRRASNRDITDLKEKEEQIRQLAYYDPLTDLPNRRLLLDRINGALAQAKRFNRSIAIMFLDLDRFKQVNDTLGHSVGDQLLKEVAARLSSCLRQCDTVARPGGDEFVIVLTEVSRPDDATQVAEKVLGTLRPSIALAGQHFDVTTSIGIAIYPINGTDDAEELMKKADMAMYAAKAAGRNTYRVFDPDAFVTP